MLNVMPVVVERSRNEHNEGRIANNEVRSK